MDTAVPIDLVEIDLLGIGSGRIQSYGQVTNEGTKSLSNWHGWPFKYFNATELGFKTILAMNCRMQSSIVCHRSQGEAIFGEQPAPSMRICSCVSSVSLILHFLSMRLFQFRLP